MHESERGSCSHATVSAQEPGISLKPQTGLRQSRPPWVSMRWVWSGARQLVFLTRSQGPRLLVQEPCLETAALARARARGWDQDHLCSQVTLRCLLASDSSVPCRSRPQRPHRGPHRAPRSAPLSACWRGQKQC